MKPRGPLAAFFVTVVLLAGIGLGWNPREPASPSDATFDAERGPRKSTSAIDAAFEAGRSDVWVEAEGIVEHLLPDDTHGSRHQRIIVRIPSGRTVLIAHNIDLPPRVEPLRRGGRLRFRGEYEWNDKGGVVHWTHHDPSGRRPGGWIERGARRVE